MEIERVIKKSFAVIGKEGSTNNGDRFIQKLRKEASDNFDVLVSLSKKNENGEPVGF